MNLCNIPGFKRRTVGLVAGCILMIILSSTASALDVYIGGKSADYGDEDGLPITENGTVLLPLYKSAELLGATVLQDNPHGTAVIVKDGVFLSCNTGSKTVYKNGSGINMQYGLVWRGGPLYVDARLFSMFDCDVYIGKESVIITPNSKDSIGCNVYISLSDRNYKKTEHYGAKYEPASGIYLGANFPENSADIRKLESKIGTSICALKLSASNLSELSDMAQRIRSAASDSSIIYCTLEEKIGGLGGSIENPENYIEAARLLEKCGGNLIVTLGECPNCTHTKYGDVNGYIERYRAFARIFRDYAPSVATAFSICAVCEDYESYYPGDIYVDYVGVSLCDSGSCNASPTELIYNVASRYSYKKPLIISKPMTSYIKKHAEASGVKEPDLLLDTYCRIQISCPFIKAAFLFGDITEELESLSNIRIHSAVSSALLSSGRILTHERSDGIGVPDIYELYSGIDIPGEMTVLYALPTNASNSLRVIYSTNGEVLEVSEAMPYGAAIDLSGYSDTDISVSVSLEDENGNKVYEKSVTVIQKAKADGKESSIFSATALLTAIAILLAGIVLCFKKINLILKA